MSPTDLQTRLTRKGQWRLSHAKKRRPKRLAGVAWSLTFPDRLKPLAERLLKEASVHLAWVGQTPEETKQSVENRLGTVLKDYPWWYGGCPVPKLKEATPAQLEALKSAREARAAEVHERERRFNARLEAAQI